MNTHNNRRSQNSVENIIRAVFGIMYTEKRPLGKITVREVCERAGINRSTFYAHFQDVYDVAESVEKRMAEMAGETFMDCLQSGGSMRKGFEGLFEFIREYKEFYLLYLEDSRRVRAIEMLMEPHQERLKQANLKDLGCVVEGEIEYRQDFFAAGLAAMLYRWLKNDCRETPGQLFEILTRQYAPEFSFLR